MKNATKTQAGTAKATETTVETPKVKKERKSSWTIHPAMKAAQREKDPVLIDALPDDWDFARHKWAPRKLWTGDKAYFNAKALYHEHMVIRSRERADEAIVGTGKARAAAKRLQKTMAKLLELQAAAKDAGFKVEDILDEKAAALLEEVASAQKAKEEKAKEEKAKAELAS